MGKYRDLAKNIGAFGLSTFATRLVSFLLIPLYTAYLSTSDFGLTDMTTTVVSLLIPVATLSFTESTIRFCIDDPDQSDRYVSVGFWTMLGSCLLTAFLLPLLGLNIFGGLDQYPLYFLAVYTTTTFLGFFSGVARGFNQVGLIAGSSILSTLISAATSSVLIAYVHLGVPGFMIGLITGNVAGCLTYILCGHHWRHISLRAMAGQKSATLRVMLGYSLPLVPNAVSWWINTSINRFFITGVLGIGASGLFAAASKIPNILNILAGIFQEAWSLSAFQQFKQEGVRQFFSNIFVFYNAMIAVSCSALMLLSPMLGSLLLRGSFYGAWVYMPVLLLAFYYSTLSSFYGTVFTASMRTGPLFTTTAAGALISLIVGYPLVHTMGLMGACIAAVLSNGAVWLLRLRVSRAILTLPVPVPSLVATNILLIAQSLTGFTPSLPFMPINLVVLVALATIQGSHIISPLRHIVCGYTMLGTHRSREDKQRRPKTN